MRALCILREEENLWVKKYFPHESPYLLHFLGKPLLEYFFDFFDLMGVEKVRLSIDDSCAELEERYENGAGYGYHFSLDYAFHGQEPTENILLKNNGFLREKDVWIFDGFFFLHYDKNHFKNDSSFTQKITQSGWMTCQKKAQVSFIPHFSPDVYAGVKKNSWNLKKSEQNQNSCSYFSSDISAVAKKNAYNLKKSASEKKSCPPLFFSTMKNTLDYYRVCMQVLKKEKECYALPGYRDTFAAKNQTHSSIVFGKGSEVQSNVELQPEMQCGDFVTIEKDVFAGPNVILGNCTHIGQGSFLSNSIVYDGVYLGKSLTIEKSILTPTHLLCVDKDIIIPTEDPLFFNQTALSSFKKRKENKIFHQIAAVVTFLFTAPFYAFFMGIFGFVSFFFRKNWVKKIKTSIFIDEKMNECEITTYVGLVGNYFVRLFFSFSFHKFPLLFVVMKRNMGFVGNEPLRAVEKNIVEVKKVKNYWASIFSFSSAYSRHYGKTNNREHQDVDFFSFSPIEERYFSHHRSAISYLKTLFFSLKKNFERY